MSIIDSAGFHHQFFDLIPQKNPVFSWDYVSAAGAAQSFFQLTLGSADGLSDLYDSGKVYGNPGDANQDGVVDQNDRRYVSSLEGVTSSDSNYDINADFNRDGTIDSDDITIVDLFMGSSYPSVSTRYTYALPLELPGGGGLIFWKLEVGDGSTAAEAKGANAVNTPPVITNVRVDGA